MPIKHSMRLEFIFSTCFCFENVGSGGIMLLKLTLFPIYFTDMYVMNGHFLHRLHDDHF